MNPQPIFFAVTRSFWLFVVTVMLILQQGDPAIRAFAQLAVTIWGAGDVEAIVAWVKTVAPVATVALLVRERAGRARPYTIKPTRGTLK